MQEGLFGVYCYFKWTLRQNTAPSDLNTFSLCLEIFEIVYKLLLWKNNFSEVVVLSDAAVCLVWCCVRATYRIIF
jgi:hypothetical protein